MNTGEGRSVKILKELDIPLVKPYNPANQRILIEDDRLLIRPIILTSLGYEVAENCIFIFKNSTAS